MFSVYPGSILCLLVQAMRKKFSVTDEMVLPFQPVNILCCLCYCLPAVYPNRCPSLKFPK